MDKFGLMFKLERKWLTAIGLLLLGQHCLAQSGYNYVRPEITNNAVGAGNLQSAATPNPIRPIVGGFATGATGTSSAYPTAATAYGGNANLNPTAAAYGGYSGGGLPPGGFGGTAGGLPKRPSTLPQQRTTGGIYGAGQSQFPGSARGGVSGGSGTGGGTGLDSDYEGGDYSAIPGVPGVDYPIYSQVPQTNFDCNQQPLPGYYSDVEAQCQVFHICALNRTYSFLCPNGTVFSQETLVCVWWNQYDCASAPSLYANNAFIYDYGNERAPTNAGFQNSPTQIGIGGGSIGRQQTTNFQTTNTIGRGQPTPSAGIYGAGSIRPTITGGTGFTASPGSSSIAPVQNTGYGSGNTAGRFSPSQAPTSGVQTTFPTASSVATPAPFGAVLRSGAGVSVGGFSGIPEGAYPNAQQGAASPANREYLPPRRP